MTDALPPPEASGDSAPFAAPEPPRPTRPWTFLGRIARALREQNWAAVAVEIVIVVLGVVIGFQVTAWGQARADAATEQTYLRQLAADLRETVRRTEEADAYMDGPDRAGGLLYDAFYAPDPPPRDSLLQWGTTSNYSRYTHPVLGTAEALGATGDLALIRDDTLRSAVTAYLQQARLEVQRQDRARGRWWEFYNRLSRQLTTTEAFAHTHSFEEREAMFGATTNYPTRHRDSTRWRFALDPDAFLADPEMEHAAFGVTTANWNLRTSRARMRTDAHALLRRVEAHIEP